jgi:nucleotide-binding universal stress UspA family protein
MLHTILLATNFEPECELVCEFSRGLIDLGVKRAVIAHVVDATGMEAPVISKKVDDARERLREVAQPLEDAGIFVELRVPAGDPFDELLALSHEAHVDCVVVGTHGKRIMQQLFEGSVSERLLQEANVPMLLVRFDQLEAAGDPRELAAGFGRMVVLATDFSASSRRAFDTTVQLPAGALQRLHLVHAFEPPLAEEKRQRVEHGALFQLENLAEIAESQGIATTVAVVPDDAKKVVLAEAERAGASGVVVGSRGRSVLQEAILGSVSMTLVRQAPCPVLVVP